MGATFPGSDRPKLKLEKASALPISELAVSSEVYDESGDIIALKVVVLVVLAVTRGEPGGTRQVVIEVVTQELFRLN